MVYEDKIFQIREYKEFPKRKGFDPIIRVCDNLEEATIRSMEMNRASVKRYYIQDIPHSEIVLNGPQREALKKKFGLEVS